MPYANLGEFLVSAPLYRVEAFPSVKLRQYQNNSYFVEAPALVDRQCDKCGPTKWQFDGGTYEGKVNEGALSHLKYKCRNCDETTFHTWILWRRGGGGAATFIKAGHFPKLEITIPNEFGRALGDKRPLYLKGMTLRHNAYGIGALTYFRRLIEDTTDEMLDLLEDSMEAIGADPAAIERLKKAKEGTRFEDKVKIAADVMPAQLRPGGINPFADLYELLSIGLHDLTDEQCCDIVDAMDQSLKFLYTQLKTHAEDAKAYEQAARSINAKLADLKKRDAT